jgi:hypothetical protein
MLYFTKILLGAARKARFLRLMWNKVKAIAAEIKIHPTVINKSIFPLNNVFKTLSLLQQIITITSKNKINVTNFYSDFHKTFCLRTIIC